MNIMIDFGYSDVKFVIENEEIPAIKSVLAIRNPFFNDLFKKEDKSIYELKGANKKGFLELCRYYSDGKLIITDENVFEIMSMCKFCGEECLLEICKTYVSNHISPFTVRRVLELYESDVNDLDMNELISKIQYFININIIEILDAELYNFKYPCLYQLIKLSGYLMDYEYIIKKLFDYYHHLILVKCILIFILDDDPDKAIRELLGLLRLELFDLSDCILNSNDYEIYKEVQEIRKKEPNYRINYNL